MANYFLHHPYYFTGEYHQAIDGLRWNIASLQGDLLYERFNSATYPSVVSRAGMATCLAELGEFAEAAAHGEAAVRIAEAVDHPYSLIQASWTVSAGYLRRGDVQHAVPLLERAARLCRLRDIPRPLYQSPIFLGFAYRLGGRIEEALPQLELAEALQKTWGTATWTCWIAEAYWLVGRFEDAGRIAGRALALSRETRERGNEAWLLRLLSELDTQRDPPAFSEGGTSLSAGPSGSKRPRYAPPRRPLPPRPRQAVPAHGRPPAGPGAPHHRRDDVSRDGHAVLAGAGGGSDGRSLEVTV
jgi:tetratricopeptide (TPR) repeat protein